jgi:hypothetical protein
MRHPVTFHLPYQFTFCPPHLQRVTIAIKTKTSFASQPTAVGADKKRLVRFGGLEGERTARETLDNFLAGEFYGFNHALGAVEGERTAVW